MNKELKDIFESKYAPLCNYAFSFLKDKHLAEDVVQSVFVDLWKNKVIFSLKEPNYYLQKSVKYKCIDQLRLRNSRKEVYTDSIQEIEAPERQIMEEEDIAPLFVFFTAQLPPKMRQVFLMSRQEGMSYREIAETLNVSIKTVEGQMGVALKKLRNLLKEHKYLQVLLSIFLS